VSSQAVARSDERVRRTNIPKDNWLGFVGDVLKFTGEVTFKSSLRIDGNFCGQVKSQDGTLIVSAGAHLTQAMINVAVAKINGTVEGDINASEEVILGQTASVTGNISARALIVEEGALLNGSCHLKEAQPEKLGPKTAPAGPLISRS
jgi:cytoskeletal protein CcmA (bactofilin family)